MKTLIANKNDDGKRLDSFLQKVLKDAPLSLIYKWIRKKRIKINKKAVTDISYRIKENDELFLYINDEYFKENTFLKKADLSLLNIVYEDENIIILNKPKGISCQPDTLGEASLVDILKTYLYEKGEFLPKEEHSFSPALCHRIDKNTKGLVIGAKNAKTLKIMNEKIKERQVKKFYVLSVEGTLEKPCGTISGYVLKDKENNTVRFFEKEQPNSKYAETEYRVLEDGKVLAQLKTGRSHQIRASFSYIGHPLKGDVKYGAKKTKDRTYQDLFAKRIEFDFTTDAEHLNYLNKKVFEIE